MTGSHYGPCRLCSKAALGREVKKERDRRGIEGCTCVPRVLQLDQRKKHSAA